MNIHTMTKATGATILMAAVSYASAGNITNGDIKVVNAGNNLVKTIQSHAKSNDQWFSYSVTMEPGNGMPCCFVNYNGGDRSCSLDTRRTSWGNDHDDLDSSTLDIYFQWRDGRPDKLFFAGNDCPVDAAGHSVVALEGVNQRTSVEWLSDYVAGESKGHGRLIAAIAMHEGQFAQQALEQLTNDSMKKVRHKAIFWLGQSRGKPGFEKLVDIVDDNSRAIKDRTKAIFAISESSAEQAQDKLMQLATTPGHDKIQSKALFWMAQSDNKHTIRVIKDILNSDASKKVKEKAVFALSQLDTDQGWEMLVDLAQNSQQHEVREKAIFWLSQGSHKDGRDATEILKDIVNGANPHSIKVKAIFALSQLPGEKGTQALLDVLGSSNSNAIKKKALFWLGQSKDPKAMEAIEDILAAK